MYTIIYIHTFIYIYIHTYRWTALPGRRRLRAGAADAQLARAEPEAGYYYLLLLL